MKSHVRTSSRNRARRGDEEFPLASDEEMERTWQRHLANMAGLECYADSLEVKALAMAFDVDIKVHREYGTDLIGDEKRGPRRMVHIAYHVSTIAIPSLFSVTWEP